MSFQEKFKESKDLLVHLRRKLKVTRDVDVQNEILQVISLLESPLFSRLVSLEDALSSLETISRSKELDAEHFDFNKDTGELVFFAREASYRRPLSSGQAGTSAKAAATAARSKWLAAGNGREEGRQKKKQPPGKGRKNVKRVEFKGEDAEVEEIAKPIRDSISEQREDPTLPDPRRRSTIPEEATPEETRKRSDLDKHLDELMCGSDGRGRIVRRGSSEKEYIGGRVERIVLARSRPEENLGFGIVEVKARDGTSLGYYVEGIDPDGLAAREGSLQESDRILSLNNHVLDSATTHERVLQLLNSSSDNSKDDHKNALEICVVRNRRSSIFQPGCSFSPFTSPSQQSAAVKKRSLGRFSEPTDTDRTTTTANTKLATAADTAADKSYDCTNLTYVASRSERVEGRKEKHKGSSTKFLPPSPKESDSLSETSESLGGQEVISEQSSDRPRRRLPTPVRVENLGKLLPSPAGLTHDRAGEPILKERSPEPVDMVLNTEWTQLEVISLVNDGTGLGFGIIGGKSTGVVAKTIVSGGVADRDGRLRSGDHILQICDVNVRGLGSEQVAAVLRQSGTHVRLLVARPVVDPSFSLKEGSEGGSLSTPGSLFSPIVPTQQLNQHIEQLNALMSAYPEMVELGTEGLLIDIDGQRDLEEDHAQLDSNLSGYHLNHVGGPARDACPSANNRLAPVNRANSFSRPLNQGLDGFGLVEGNLIHTIDQPSKTEQASSGNGEIIDKSSPTTSTARGFDTDRDRIKCQSFDVSSVAEVTSQNEGLKSQSSSVGSKRPSLVTVVERSSLESIQSPEAKPATFSGAISSGTATTISMAASRSLDAASEDAAVLMETKAEVLGIKDVDYLDVELVKGSSGLGITVVGYSSDTPEEDISGIFVRSIAENSVAYHDNRLRPNDQIIEVDGRSLKGLTNQQSVEVLRCTGQMVRLKVARYNRGKKFEQLQKCSSIPIESTGDNSVESARHVIIPISRGKRASLQLLETFEAMAHHSDEILVNKWKKILGDGFDIIVANLMKLKEGGGLGMSLEGTVDVEDGIELHPHHYIRSIYPRGPIAVNGRLKVGDELLEVNGIEFYGMDRMHVVSTLKELPQNVCVVAARPSRPRQSKSSLALSDGTAAASSLGFADSRYLAMPEIAPSGYKVKAKSEIVLVDLSTGDADESRHPKSGQAQAKGQENFDLCPIDHVPERSRSKSLEPISRFGVWSDRVTIVELNKSDRGLGFSILDYQDPLNPDHTIIVVGSLVPGGVAHSSGKIVPGDRLVFVNDVSLYSASLEDAVAALKSAPRGKALLGILKPVPVRCTESAPVADDEQNYESETTPLLDKQLPRSSKSTTALGSSYWQAKFNRSVPFPLHPAGKTEKDEEHRASGEVRSTVNGSRTITVYVADDQPCVMNLSTPSSSSSENEYVIGNGKDGSAPVTQQEYLMSQHQLLQQQQGQKPTLLPKPKFHVKTAERNGQFQGSRSTPPFQTTEGAVRSPPGVSPLPQPSSSSSSPPPPQLSSASPPQQQQQQQQQPLSTSSAAAHLSCPQSTLSQQREQQQNLAIKSAGLLHSVERKIVVCKGNTPLGLTLEIAPLLIKYGCVVRCVSGAMERDGRISVGDLILSINGESLQEVTNYQAKSILRRVALTGNEMSVVYVRSKDISQLFCPSREELSPALKCRVK